MSPGNTSFCIIKNCIFLFAFFALTSCNLTRSYIRKTEKQYAKLGVTEWTDKTDSASIFWRKVGHGDDNLLLLHGFGPLTEMQWEGIVQELHNDFTLYIPDLLYFGQSTTDFKNYDPRFTVNQLHQFIEKEHLEALYVAGISYGGLISSMYAHEHPELTKGLILIDALSKFLDDGHTDSLANTYGYENIQDILIPSDGKSLKTLFQISFYKPRKIPAWMLNRPARILYANQKAEKRSLLHYLSANSNELSAMDVAYHRRVQIIWGQEDQLIPISNGMELEKLYPNSSLMILPEIGHVANMESPKEVAEIIRNFVNNSP